MNITAQRSLIDALGETTFPRDLTLPYAQAQRQVSLSVLTPVFNERHLVLASLARVLSAGERAHLSTRTHRGRRLQRRWFLGDTGADSQS